MSESQPTKAGFLSLGKHWPYVIVGMLVFHASIMLGTIAYVSAKNDLYVEPNYYAKAIDWDTQRAMQEAADKMGWTVDVIADEPNADGLRVMRVILADANGDPIEGALVEAELFHPAHATDRHNAVMLADQNTDGVYQRSFKINTPGFWQAKLSIRFQGVKAIVSREFKIKGSSSNEAALP